jgi:hypothetical protein
MSFELSNEEKKRILINLINNYENTRFLVQSELDAELSIDNPLPNVADGYSQQILDLSQKIEYIENRINLLNNE